MSNRKATRGGKASRDVIDIGEGGAPPSGDPDAESAEEREDDASADEVDEELLTRSSTVIDVSADDDGEAEGDDGGQGAAPHEQDEDPVGLEPRRGTAAVVAPRGHLGKRDPLAIYMAETRRYPLLTPTEEHDLAVRLVEHGDNVAARRLVEANLRLVVKIAYEYRRAHRNLLDLVQEGNIGLMQAVRKFDPYRGVKLSSYAAFWIRAYILKFILNNWRLVKIGTTQAQRKLFFNLRKEREKLEQLGFQPTTALLAKNLDVSEQDVVDMERRLAAPEASLDAPLGNDDDGARSRLDYLEGGERPDHAVARGQFSELLRSKLEVFASELEGREQAIFRERWLTEDPLTLQELGDRYGVSRERARQLEKRLLGRLRKYLEAEFGSAVDIGALTRD
ncbi:MAG: RNA polymerase factor sigma-32 [Kofleriaceae bacterium]